MLVGLKRAPEAQLVQDKSKRLCEGWSATGKGEKRSSLSVVEDVGIDHESKRIKTLIKWEYGIGEEGVKSAPGKQKRIHAIIVDDCFPWWLSPARSVEFNVTNIWLIDYTALDRIRIVENWCGTSIVDVGINPSDRFIQALKKSEVVLIGGAIPETLFTKGIWNSKVRCVISTKESRIQSKEPWMLSRVNISHTKVGGVTDGNFKLGCHLKGASIHNHSLLEDRMYVPQDLRCILKSKEMGRVAQAPVQPESTQTGGKVTYCGKHLISEAGLYPLLVPDVEVLTRYRQNQWVVRSLSLMERLLAHDIPEHLIRCFRDNEDRLWLLNSVGVPIKVLQHMVEACSKICREESGEASARPTIIRAFAEDAQIKDLVAAQQTKKRTGFLATITEKDIVSMADHGAVNHIRLESRNSVATKSDDAKAQTDLWNDRVKQGLHIVVGDEKFEEALKVMRKYLLRAWKVRVWKSYLVWEVNENACGRTVDDETKEDAWDCLSRCFHATWWAWDHGSRPFFWRWPKDYQAKIQYGVPVWFKSEVKRWTCKQKRVPSGIVASLIRDKLNNIRTKGYVEKGEICSLMSYFNVPKGKDDIRMVYDGTKSGLNESLWAPWFPLPTVEGLIRSLDAGFSMADNDVGEMFHNFVLHKDLRRFCGLDVSPYFGKGNTRTWERWTRLAMGLRNSPYNAVQGMMIAKEVIVGKRTDRKNIFRWETVCTNLPGTQTYEPCKSWVRKVRADGVTAADVFIYVDDVRTSAPTKDEAWEAAQQTSSTLGFLGLQDAARKRREPGQETGAWTGSVVWTSNDKIVVLTTKEKWDKTKSHLKWIRENMNNPQGMDSKKLQSIRGFLVYIARTYTSFVPYLKGIHATIDSWRPGRSGDGWKYIQSKQLVIDEVDTILSDAKFGMVQVNKDEPAYVFPVPRLASDIHCLSELTSMDFPPHRQVRMTKEGRVIYGFGDASKQGFGISVELSDKSVLSRSGKFTTIVQEQSSNFRELLNLVEYIEDIFTQGLLDNCELFMFTDNATAEAAYFKGSSKSEALFNLVLRLRKIEMSGKCVLHMIHIAGTRMIWQGTDGLSRGDRNAGVMAGDSMLSFVPLHLSAMDRSPVLLEWCTSWGAFENEKILPMKILEIKDWYIPLVDTSTYVWLPPPAIADVAGELMAQAIHKRPTSTHIFICPRLMSARWMRLVLKATDALWTIPLGSSVWDISHHEPLVLAISFPLSRNKPWKHRGTPYMDHKSKLVQTVLKSDCGGAGIMLRELVVRARLLAGM